MSSLAQAWLPISASLVVIVGWASYSYYTSKQDPRAKTSSTKSRKKRKPADVVTDSAQQLQTAPAGTLAWSAGSLTKQMPSVKQHQSAPAARSASVASTASKKQKPIQAHPAYVRAGLDDMLDPALMPESTDAPSVSSQATSKSKSGKLGRSTPSVPGAQPLGVQPNARTATGPVKTPKTRKTEQTNIPGASKAPKATLNAHKRQASSSATIVPVTAQALLDGNGVVSGRATSSVASQLPTNLLDSPLSGSSYVLADLEASTPSDGTSSLETDEALAMQLQREINRSSAHMQPDEDWAVIGKKGRAKLGGAGAMGSSLSSEFSVDHITPAASAVISKSTQNMSSTSTSIASKKQRQNAKKAAAVRADKQAAEDERLARLAAHKRELEREKMRDQYKSVDAARAKQNAPRTTKAPTATSMSAQVVQSRDGSTALIWE